MCVNRSAKSVGIDSDETESEHTHNKRSECLARASRSRSKKKRRVGEEMRREEKEEDLEMFSLTPFLLLSVSRTEAQFRIVSRVVPLPITSSSAQMAGRRSWRCKESKEPFCSLLFCFPFFSCFLLSSLLLFLSSLPFFSSHFFIGVFCLSAFRVLLWFVSLSLVCTSSFRSTLNRSLSICLSCGKKHKSNKYRGRQKIRRLSSSSLYFYFASLSHLTSLCSAVTLL